MTALRAHVCIELYPPGRSDGNTRVVCNNVYPAGAALTDTLC